MTPENNLEKSISSAKNAPIIIVNKLIINHHIL